MLVYVNSYNGRYDGGRVESKSKLWARKKHFLTGKKGEKNVDIWPQMVMPSLPTLFSDSPL